MWLKSNKKRIEASAVVYKTPLGNIEYSIKGSEPFVLCIHGMPGLHDGDQGYFDEWLSKGFGVIAPSRPGYGRSDRMPTYDEQAD